MIFIWSKILNLWVTLVTWNFVQAGQVCLPTVAPKLQHQIQSTWDKQKRSLLQAFTHWWSYCWDSSSHWLRGVYLAAYVGVLCEIKGPTPHNQQGDDISEDGTDQNRTEHRDSWGK